MPRNPAVFKMLQLARLPRLLDMMYTPQEIEEELGVPRKTVIKAWIPYGAPFKKDATGHYWVNGVAFREWAKTRSRKAMIVARSNRGGNKKLPADKAYCLSCHAVVGFEPKRSKPLHRGANMLTGICPVCGKGVSKIASSKEQAND